MNTHPSRRLAHAGLMTAIALFATTVVQAETAPAPRLTSSFTSRQRVKQWERYWVPGKRLVYLCQYEFCGNFNLPQDKLLSPVAKLLIGDLKGKEEETACALIRAHGSQGTNILPLANGWQDAGGLWLWLAYQDNGTVKMSELVALGGADRLKGLIDSTLRRDDSYFDNIREDWRKKNGDPWKITEWFSGNWGDLAKRMEEAQKKHEENRRKVFSDSILDADDNRTVKVDIRTFRSDNPQLKGYEEIRGAALSFLEDFSGRSIFLYATPRPTPRESGTSIRTPNIFLIEGRPVYAGPDGEELLTERTKARLDLARDPEAFYGLTKEEVWAWEERMRERVKTCANFVTELQTVEEDLKAKDRWSIPRLYRALAAKRTNHAIWIPEKRVQDSEDKEMFDTFFFNLHRSFIPNSPALFWGVEALGEGKTLEFDVGGRKVGEKWAIEGDLFNALKHKNWKDYMFSQDSKVVVELEDDNAVWKGKNEGQEEEGVACYLLRVVKTGEVDTWRWSDAKGCPSTAGKENVETKLEFVPVKNDGNKPVFSWAGLEKDNDRLLNKIYIEKATGQVVYYRIPLTCVIGADGGKEIPSVIPGLTLRPGSTVRLDFEAELNPHTDDLSEKVKTEHPFYAVGMGDY